MSATATMTATTTGYLTDVLYAAVQARVSGITLDTLGETLPESGYWVGGQSWTLTKSVDNFTRDDVEDYVAAHPASRFFGVWVENGRAYLDITDHVESARAAHQLACQRCEFAVFNISSGQCELTVQSMR